MLLSRTFAAAIAFVITHTVAFLHTLAVALLHALPAAVSLAAVSVSFAVVTYAVAVGVCKFAAICLLSTGLMVITNPVAIFVDKILRCILPCLCCLSFDCFIRTLRGLSIRLDGDKYDHEDHA